jgi:hypothetical protein
MEDVLQSSAKKQASPVTAFCLDLFYLLWWSFLYPSRLAAYMQTLHPEMTPRTGFSQQLWLAYRSAAVRRLFSLQLAVWLLVGALSTILFLLTWAILNLSSLTSEDMAFAMAFGIAGSLMVGVAFLVAEGLPAV